MDVYGTDNPDQLTGTNGNDRIDGKGGDDTISPLLGNDSPVTGGTGSDLLQVDYSAVTSDSATLSYSGADGGLISAGSSAVISFSAFEQFNVIMTNQDDYIEFNGVFFDGVINGLNGFDSLSLLDLSSVAPAGAQFNNSSRNIIYGSANLKNFEAFYEVTLGSGADTVQLSGDYNDLIRTGEGDDVVNTGLGYDSVYGDGGSDLMVVNYSSVTGAAGGLFEHFDDLTGDASVGTAHLARFYGFERVQFIGTPQDDTMQGGSGNDTLSGGNGADQLNGGGGANRLMGGLGNDFYEIDSSTDTLVEAASQGTDSVESSVNYSLRPYFENLTLTDDFATTGIGNELANLIDGNQIANTINGAAGSDTMRGGAGSDNYFVDVAGDRVTELSTIGAGSADLVRASIDYRLPVNVENLTLTGEATQGIGNDSENQITGNTLANTLNGGSGNDLLIGRGGNDTYIVNTALDVIQEANTPNEIDTVRASSQYTLDANVERLYLIGTAINGLGNNLANTIVGNAAINNLFGYGRNDTLNGAAGNDSLTGSSVDGGAAEVDKLIGGDGKDTFVLGTINGRFYDEGTASKAGKGNYALIADFTVGADRLQLKGAADDYRLGASGVDGVKGSGLFLETGATDELIAIIASADDTRLTAANTIATAECFV